MSCTIRYRLVLIVFAVLGFSTLSTLWAQKPATRPEPTRGGAQNAPVGGNTTKGVPGGTTYAPKGTGTSGAHAPSGTGETGDSTPPSGTGSGGGDDDYAPSGGGRKTPTGGDSGGTTIQPPTGFGTPTPGTGTGGNGGDDERRRRGGTTGPLGQGFPDDSWQNWWAINEGFMLDIERRYRETSQARDESRDLFAGEIDPEAPSPIEARGAAIRRSTLPIFKSLLDHNSPFVRAEACIAIGRAGGEDQVKWLVPMTKDNELIVRKAAIIALGLLRNPSGLPYLQHIVRDRGAQIIERSYASVAIGMLGKVEGVGFLIERLKKGQRVLEIDAGILYGIGLIPDARARRFLDYYVAQPLNDDSLRAVAVMGLGLQRSPESLDVLLAALRDKDVRVRRSAAIALGQIDFESVYRSEWEELEASVLVGAGDDAASDRAIGELESYRARLRVKLEADETRLADLRSSAIDALGKFALEDADVMVRNFALIALGDLGGETAGALIKGQLDNSGLDSTKAFAALALALHGDDKAGEYVHNRLARRKMDQQTKAAMLLALGLTEEVEAVPAIRKQFRRGGDVAVARYSAIALGLLGDEKVVEPLREALLSKSRPELKRAQGQALALLGDYVFTDMAGKILARKGSVAHKVQIAQALSQSYDQRSIGMLLESADPKARKDLVLASIVRALGVLSERGELPILAPLFRRLNYTLRFRTLNEIALI